jgi:hypothetical protein
MTPKTLRFSRTFGTRWNTASRRHFGRSLPNHQLHTVAAAMIRLTKSGRQGVEIINSQDILKA